MKPLICELIALIHTGMISHCGFEQDMKIQHNNITDELMCAMRVHLMNDTEMNVFCPAEVKVWQENCMDVEFLNFTAISLNNEMNVITALRSSIHSLLSNYPSSVYEDQRILLDVYTNRVSRHNGRSEANEFETSDIFDDNFEFNNETANDSNADDDSDSRKHYGDIIVKSIQLRYKEKELLYSALDFLSRHEDKINHGNVTFQLELKSLEREQANLRQIEHEKFMEQITETAKAKQFVSSIEVNTGAISSG